MNKLKTMIYGSYLACALCFGKSAEVVFSSDTPLVEEYSSTSLDLLVACFEYNAPGSIIAKGISPTYAEEMERRFEVETGSYVKKLKDIVSNPDFKKQVNESNNAVFECWGYQLFGLLMAGIGGFYHIKAVAKNFR